MKQIIVIVVAVLLVIPTAPVLYVLAGGGSLGSVLCLLLGVVAYLAVGVVVGLLVEAYTRFKYRNVYVEPPKPMPIPVHTTYEIDWTKINKEDRL